MRDIKTREGFKYWDKICAVKHYGFIHSPDNSRVLKAEGLGNWIDKYEAQSIVDAAEQDLNEAQSQLAALREELASVKRIGPPHFCGLPMSLNPHQEAGIPGRFLEVGTVRECIPCLVASRHSWAKTAGELQLRLADAERRNAELEANATRYESLRKIGGISWTGNESSLRMTDDDYDSCVDEYFGINPNPEAASHDE